MNDGTIQKNRKAREGDMNKKALVAFAAAAILTIAALPLAAQTVALTANVPFPFMVGTKAVDAGEYTITNDTGAQVIILRNVAEQGGAASIVTKGGLSAIDRARETHLVFNRYGDRYFLAKVVDADGGIVMALPQGAPERELAKIASVERENVPAVVARR
jgi:hypothetical protein